MDMEEDDLKRLELVSPYGGETAIYTWPLHQLDKDNKTDGCIEIIETIRWVFEDIPELRDAIRQELNNFTLGEGMKNYDSMRNLCDKYNTALEEILRRKPLKKEPLKRPDTGLLKHIIQKSYNHAVSDPEKLNEYKSWSPEVYGETSFEFVAQMLETINVRAGDVFIDLGSGVGQVVLQVAASVPLKKCIGIEKADVPDRYARELDRHFKFWMQWFGRTYSEYELIKGDFFEERFHQVVTNSTFIFVNNYAFGPKVDHALKKLFEELKDGSRIFSSKAFSPVNFRITDRNLNDIGTMMHVRELQPAIKGSVSWTDNSVSYYCHTIDRTKLENYFLNMKGPRKDGEKRGRGRPRNSDSSNVSSGNDSSNDSASPDSNHDSGNGGSKSSNNKGLYSTASKGKQENKSSKGFDDENIIYGPTTRKAWNEYWKSLGSSQKDNDTGNATSALTTKTRRDHDKGKSLSGKRIETRSSDKEINNENEKQPVKKTRGRPRKYAPGVSAVVNRAKKGKVTKASKVPIINEHRRGRPPKHGKGGLKKKGGKEGSSLDMLHQQTLLSIQSRSGKRLSPAPGCVDKKLSDASAPKDAEEKDQDVTKDDLLSTSPPPFPSSLASLVTPGVMPSVIIKDSSLLSVNEELDRLVDKWKSQMLSFLTHMQMPEFKSSLVKQIEAEKNRRHSLTAQIDAMEKSIKGLQEKGVFALRAKLSELGIHANTSDEVLDQARQIVAHNKALLEKESQLQAQVAREESVYAEICRVYEKNIREKKIDRRFFQELTGSLDPHKRLQDTERSENTAPEKSSTPSSASSSPARSQNSRTTRSTPQNKNGPERDSETPLSGVGPPPLKKTAAPKQVKAKKEPKKRGRKPKAADKNASLTDGSLPEPPPLKKPFDLSDAKISIKGSPLRPETGNKTSSSTGSANSGSSPSEHRDSPAHEKSEEAPRLTLTFVINREKNNFSVKSPSKTPPHKSPYPAKNSPKSPADAVVAASSKRKKRSPSRDLSATTTRSATKKTRSSKSSGPDTSSESEARIKIKLGPKEISVEPVVSNSPATNNTTDERNKSVPSTPAPLPNSTNATSTNTIPSAVTSESQTTTTASRLPSANGKRSKFDKLLAVASHEMSLQAAAEASNSGSTSSISSSALGEATRTLVPSPSISASSRPSSSASSSSFNTTSTATTNNPPAISQQHHQMLSDVAFGRRAPCVNTPPQTPSPSLSSSDRPITPGGGSTTSSMSPLLHQQHQHYQQHIQNQQQSQQQQSSSQSSGNSSSFSHNFSDSLAAHLQNPHHPLSSSESSAHHQFFNSLQSMKNLASMTAFGVPQQPGMDSTAPRRKPGRPPKKSISNEMWATQPPVDSQPRTTLSEQLSNSSGAANLTTSHPHLSSSLNQCQYSNSNDNVATDYSVIRNRNSQTTNSTSNAYSQHQQTSSSSTNPSSQSKTSYGSRSSSSTPVSSHPEGMSNYYPHNPYAPPGPSGPQSVALSVIRRHETSGAPPPPTHQAPYPFPGFPMIAGTYPHLPANIPFESLQKELTRNYNYYNRLNGLVEVALSAQQQKLLQSGPNRSSLDAVCKRDFNPASYQGSKSSQIPSILSGEITPGK